MSVYKDNNNDADSIKKREYLKQQHQLRTMTKTNNVILMLMSLLRSLRRLFCSEYLNFFFEFTDFKC